MRVAADNSIKTALCAALSGAASLLVWSAQAAGAHVENRCSRLSIADYEELDARIQLLLKSERSEGPPPAVVCNAQSAWVEWNGQRFAITGRAPMVDEVVDIVEGQLHDDERSAEANPKSAEDRAVAAGQPMLEAGAGAPPPPPPVAQPAAPRAARATDARGGGVSISIENELPGGSLPYAIGPAIDFGAFAGPLLIGGREAFRLTTSGRQLALMDFEGSVGIGAPFNPDARFGAVLRFGAEWMVAYPEGNSGQAAVTPEVDLGARVAHNFGWVGLWFGVDGRYRLRSLALHAREQLVARDIGVSLSVGVAFVDWSRK